VTPRGASNEERVFLPLAMVGEVTHLSQIPPVPDRNGPMSERFGCEHESPVVSTYSAIENGAFHEDVR